MNRTTIRGGLCAAMLCVTFASVPVSAQTTTSSTPMPDIDCTKVSDMMADGGAAHMPPVTGDVDKDSMAMAKVHMEAIMMLMNVEMKCGKDPKMKAAATKASNFYHDSPAMYFWPLIANGG